MPSVSNSESVRSKRWRVWLGRGCLLLLLLGVAVAAGVRFRPIRPPAPPAEAVLEVVLDQVTLASAESLPEVSEVVEPFRLQRFLKEPSSERLEGYSAQRSKTVLDLQLYRETSQAPIEDEAGLEARRAAAGMISWEAYRARMTGRP